MPIMVPMMPRPIGTSVVKPELMESVTGLSISVVISINSAPFV